MNANENQIVVYQPNETVRLDVRLENETVWLTQEQMPLHCWNLTEADTTSRKICGGRDETRVTHTQRRWQMLCVHQVGLIRNPPHQEVDVHVRREGREGEEYGIILCGTMNDFDEYLVAGEPDKRERAYGWATAIGLQDVDGLKVSDFLLNTAKRNIEGEITQAEAGKIIDAYYETKEGHDQPEDRREADKVARRINEVINSPTFRFSPEYYLGLHGRLFKDVFPHAGKIREVELTKREWVLNGDTVNYTPSFMVKESLAYDFAEEKKFRYSGLSEDAFAEHFASFISGLWQIHPFREGNTRTVAVFAIKYLRSMRYDVTKALFKEKSWYFRNALVRANYENPKLNVEKTQLPLEEFFKVLIYGYDIELRNRFLRIGYEYGTQKAEAVKNLHRHEAVLNDGVKQSDVGINAGINVGIKYNGVLSRTEENAVRAILRDNRITAKALSVILGVTLRQAERIMVSLKRKANLRREGSRKKGRWVFGEG